MKVSYSNLVYFILNNSGLVGIRLNRVWAVEGKFKGTMRALRQRYRISIFGTRLYHVMCYFVR